MEVKLIEIRDKGTFIPAMAIRLYADEGTPDHWLLRRAGYDATQIENEFAEPYIILAKLDGLEAHYDPFDWPNRRTMGTVHRHLIELWDEIKSGDVIDVEFILGETQVAKVSERLE